jgi:hypothetical protein
MGADPGFERFSGEHVIERYAAAHRLSVEEVRDAIIDWVTRRGGRVDQLQRPRSRALYDQDGGWPAILGRRSCRCSRPAGSSMARMRLFPGSPRGLPVCLCR